MTTPTPAMKALDDLRSRILSICDSSHEFNGYDDLIKTIRAALSSHDALVKILSTEITERIQRGQSVPVKWAQALSQSKIGEDRI